MHSSAPVIIFVVGSAAGGAVSCVLECENMIIAEKSFNLGICDTGFGACVKGNTEVGKALELKKNDQIYSPILLGYPKSTPSPL